MSHIIVIINIYLSKGDFRLKPRAQITYGSIDRNDICAEWCS